MDELNDFFDVDETIENEQNQAPEENSEASDVTSQEEPEDVVFYLGQDAAPEPEEDVPAFSDVEFTAQEESAPEAEERAVEQPEEIEVPEAADVDYAEDSQPAAIDDVDISEAIDDEVFTTEAPSAPAPEDVEVPVAEEIEVTSVEVPVAEQAQPREEPIPEQPVVAPVVVPVQAVTAEAPKPQPAEASPSTAVAENVTAQPEGLAPDYKARHMRREREGYAGGFRLAAGEKVLSMYRLFKHGRVYMTERRLLVESSMHTDLPIAKVAGFSVGSYTKVRVGKLLFGILFMLICAGTFVSFLLPNILAEWSVFEDMPWLKYVFFAVGGLLGFIGFLMFCTSFKKRFLLTVFTEGVQQTLSVRSAVGKGDIDIFQAIAYGAPGKDYKRFYSEAGARLLDIKRTYYAHKRAK